MKHKKIGDTGSGQDFLAMILKHNPYKENKSINSTSSNWIICKSHT